MMQNGNNFNDAVDSEDVLVNSVRAIKLFLIGRMDEVAKTKVPEAKVEFKEGYTKALEDMQAFVKKLSI
jgi:hypothetical protein